MLTAEDRLAIQELVARASFCVDAHDADEFAATFAEDGSFDYDGRAEIAGRDAIHAFIVRHFAAGNEDGACHVNTNFMAEGDGDVARARSRVVKFKTTPTGARVVAVASYTDELVKRDGAWRFRRRSVKNQYVDTSAVDYESLGSPDDGDGAR